MVEVSSTEKHEEIPKLKNWWDWMVAPYKDASHIRGVCGFF